MMMNISRTFLASLTCVATVGLLTGVVITLTAENGHSFKHYLNAHFNQPFSATFATTFSSIFASTFSPPAITISEIMSCPSTGNKEWVELQRTQDSANQLPTTSAFSLANYQLEDDKAIIWNGSETIPTPGPITGNSADTISSSIAGYFSEGDQYTTITFNRHYLNNSGDILKLWSPTGELLDEAIIPACQEMGTSWTFQDGDWTSTPPTPGQPNPISAPIYNPTPLPNPTPTPQPSQHPSPSPASNQNASPTPSPSSTSNQEKQSISSQKTQKPDQEIAIHSSQTNGSTTPSYFPENSYIQLLNKNTVSKRDEQNTATETASMSQTYTNTQGTTLDSESLEQILGLHQDTTITSNIDPFSHLTNLMYSPDRSLLSYISVILGGLLFTSSSGLCIKKYTQNTIHETISHS